MSRVDAPDRGAALCDPTRLRVDGGDVERFAVDVCAGFHARGPLYAPSVALVARPTSMRATPGRDGDDAAIASDARARASSACRSGAATPSGTVNDGGPRRGGARASAETSDADDARRTVVDALARARRTTGVGNDVGDDVDAMARAEGWFYSSRTFVKKTGTPTSDTEDAEETAGDREDAPLINEFVDLAAEEVDFMCKWNAVARRFNCLGECESAALCEAFARAHGRDLAREDFFNYFLRTMFGMFEFGVMDREGIVRALRAASSASRKRRISQS